MSFQCDNSDGIWSKVVSKRRRNKKSTAFSCSGTSSISPSHHFSDVSLREKVLAAEIEISNSAFYSSFLETFSSCIGSRCIQEIICYGIGSFSESVVSRFQLGFLLLLQKRLNTSALIYDPALIDIDKALLQELNCCVIAENDDACRSVVSETLVVFPHVPKQLINNFLAANWCDNLAKCFLLCNSFSKINEDNTDSHLKTNFPFIFKTFDHHSEFKIANNFRFKDIFNDLSIHIFPDICQTVSLD